MCVCVWASLQRGGLPTVLLTCTLGPGPQGGSGSPRPTVQGSGEQHADLIFGVGVQVSDLVCGLVHRRGVDQHSGQRAVLHLQAHGRVQRPAEAPQEPAASKDSGSGCAPEPSDTNEEPNRRRCDITGNLLDKLAQKQKVPLRSGAHLPVDDGPVAVDGVGVELDPQVGGANGRQLGRGDGDRRLCQTKEGVTTASHACARARTGTHTHVHTHARTHLHVQTHTHTCTHTLARTHTHTRSHALTKVRELTS